jgi:hypothetical protein
VSNRYAAAGLSIAITVAAAVAGTNQFSPVVLLQLAILTITAVTTYAVPLVPTGYAGKVKVGLEAVGAVLTAVVPYIVQGTITGPQVAIVLLAALKVLAAHVGVVARLTSSH